MENAIRTSLNIAKEAARPESLRAAIALAAEKGRDLAEAAPDAAREVRSQGVLCSTSMLSAREENTGSLGFCPDIVLCTRVPSGPPAARGLRRALSPEPPRLRSSRRPWRRLLRR